MNKILFILNRKIDYNYYLHAGFLEDSPYESLFYGPICRLLRHSLLDISLDLGDIIRENDIDLVVFYRGKMTDLDWLDVNKIKKINKPKVLIDVDFLKGDKLHVNFDLHLLRHPIDLLVSENLKRDILPFAIDPAVYLISASENREGICFAGAKDHPVYAIRKLAISILNPCISNKILFSGELAKFYSSHIAGLTCSGITNKLVGKHFEIAGTGTLLFTNGDNGIESYLPKDTYIKYNRDCSDIKQLWEEVKSDKDYWLEKAQKCAKHVHHYHTYKNRWDDFFDILRKQKLI